MKKCSFCSQPLDGSKEHVLQECLGAKWKSASILCHECNTLFGTTIDISLADAFTFFRNFLRVRGKREKIPTLRGLVNEAGEEFIKDGDTGELVKKHQKYVHSEKRADGTRVLHIKGEIEAAVRIAEEQKKKLEKKGFKFSEGRFSGYRAYDVGPLDFDFECSLPTYIALYKSLVNYCRMRLPEGEMARIFPFGRKIRDFAKCCERFEDMGIRVEKARALGLAGYPLVVKVAEKAKALIQGRTPLFHALVLVPRDDGWYGAVCLFNEIWWGVRLADGRAQQQKPYMAVFDIEAGGKVRPGSELPESACADFEFLALQPEAFFQEMEKVVSKVARYCMYRDHAHAARRSCVPGGLAAAFPITSGTEIRNILLDRAQTLLTWCMAPHGIPVGFFRSKHGEPLAETLVMTVMDSYGKEMRIDSGNYEEIIGGVYKMCEDLAENPQWVACVKYLLKISRFGDRRFT